MATEQIILDLQVKGGQAALTEAAELNKAIRSNKQSIKELSKDYDKNAVEIQRLNGENKNLSQEQRNLAKSSQAVKGSYNALSAEMAELKRRQKNVNVSTKEGEQTYNKYGQKINDINNKLKKLDETNGVHTRNVGNYQNALKDATGRLNIMGVNVGMLSTQFATATAVIGGTTSAIKGTNIVMKAFKVALASTGIGALVIALGSLVAYLTTTQEGLDKVNSVLRPLSALFQRLLGVLQELGGKVFAQLSKAVKNPIQAFKDLGEVIVNNVLNRLKAFQVFIEAINLLLEGNWREALKKGADAVIQLTTGITDGTDKMAAFGQEVKQVAVNALDAGANIDKMKKAYEEFEIDVTRRSATLRRIFEEQKSLSDDVNLSIRERITASRKAAAALKEATDLEISLIQKKLAIRLEEQKLNDTSRADLLENAKLEAQIEQLRARQAKRVNDVANREIALQIQLNKELAQELKLRDDIIKKVESQGEQVTVAYGKMVSTQQVANAELDEEERKLLRNMEIRKAITTATISGIQNSLAFSEVYSQFQQAAMQRELAMAGNNAEQRAAIEKKFARRQQQIAISQAILRGALAIQKIAADVPKGDFGISTAILIGLQAAQTAAQVAVIKSQKFARGGLIQGGLFEGASHANGGVKFAAGGRVHEAEGGEAIINKNSTSMFKPLLSAINVAGGGKRFALGDVVPDFSTSLNSVSNSDQAQRLESALGGYTPVLAIPQAMAVQNGIQVIQTNSTL